MGLEDPFRKKQQAEVHEKTESQILDNTLEVIHNISSYIRSEHSATYHIQCQNILKAFTSLIAALQSSNAPNLKHLERTHFLLTAFVDLAVIDGMAAKHVSTDSFRHRYARESKDSTHNYVFSSDQFYKSLNDGRDTLFKDTTTETLVVESPHVPSTSIELSFQEIEQMLSDLQDNRADRYYIRKTRTVAQLEESQRIAFEARHREHYKNLLTIDTVPPENVYLTSSGTRANDAVIRALRKQYPHAQADFLYGWYYENLREIELFETAEPCDAKILFLNVESSFPIDDQKYNADFNEYVRRGIDSAHSHPDVPHFLVIDCTTDVLIGSEFFSSLPPNMTLIKTCSLTKHQRGGTNYFFGAIALWTKDQTLDKAIHSEIFAADAALNQFEATHFPRLRKTELQETMERNERLQRAFNSSFSETQRILPEALQCKLYNYNFFTYVAKPFNRVSNAPSNNVFQLDRPDLCLEADSFGLAESRVCSFYTVLHGNDQERLSFGTDATEEQMIELGSLAAQQWVECVTSSAPGREYLAFLSDENLDRDSLCRELDQFYAMESEHITTVSNSLQQLTGKSVLTREGLSSIDREGQQFYDFCYTVESLEKASFTAVRKQPQIFGLYWLVRNYRIRMTLVRESKFKMQKKDDDPLTVSDFRDYLSLENRLAPNPYTRPDEYLVYLRSYVDEWKEALSISDPNTLNV